MRRPIRPLSPLLLALCLPLSSLSAQDRQPADTARAQLLPELQVTVTRQAEALERVPAAVGVVGLDDLRRAQPTIGLDESLNNIPGVYVANRYNFSLDQRLSIRGFGSRSNFGLRGVKVLLDGVPQTLPDGQSQLTNVEFGALERIEVLRGAASSLYGNAAGGVISMYTERPGDAPLAQALRVEGGSFGSLKWQSRTAGRAGALGGTLSISRFTTDGFRDWSTADLRQLNAGADWAISGATLATLRFSAADNPRADNPGALTFAEYAASPDSAAPNNLTRRAGKAVTQQQLALGVRHATSSGLTLDATAFGLLRDLENPLATGTYVRIDRQAGGARIQGTYTPPSDAETPRRGARRAPRLTAGVDIQRMRDDRTNFASDAGQPTTEVQLDQRERVTELGPFAQVENELAPGVLVGAGARWDRVAFDVQDRFLGDSVDQSGERTMSAWSWHAGVSWAPSEAITAYGNFATSFETPTTTELANRPGDSGGFNDQLDPQRARSFEIGLRGRAGPRLEYSLAAFTARVRDAIVQFREIGGRAYFTNAGRTRNRGLEAGVLLRAAAGLTLFGSYTFADYRFTEYRIVDGETTDTLDGNRLPGVPRHFARLAVRAEPVAGVALDLDQTLSASLWADDANTLDVPGWGAGVTNLRASWRGPVGRLSVEPFVGVSNLFDRDYIASVTINGFGGRVLEPAPGRHLYMGAEVEIGGR